MAVTVTSGANARSVEGLEGQTVGQIRTAFASIYGIDSGDNAKVNGRDATDSATLEDGDEVAFSKRTAQKGARK